MIELENDDKDYIADQKLKNALRIAEPYDGPWIDYERTYTIGAVVQELKVREEALRVLAAAYRAKCEEVEVYKASAISHKKAVIELTEKRNAEKKRADLYKHKADQYDSVVEAIAPADGGRYREDTIQKIRCLKERADKLSDKVRELQELLRLITEKQALVPICYTEPGEEIWDEVLGTPSPRLEGEWPS